MQFTEFIKTDQYIQFKLNLAMTAETVIIFLLKIYLQKGRSGGEKINSPAKCSLHILVQKKRHSTVFWDATPHSPVESTNILEKCTVSIFRAKK
jgi:hypothetical protein